MPSDRTLTHLLGVADMHSRPIFAALIAVFGILSIAGAQDPGGIPGGIKLLPGYKHEKLKGIDTRVGRISKDGALILGYDNGRLAGNAAKSQPKESLLWQKEQVVDGRAVQLALT